MQIRVNKVSKRVLKQGECPCGEIVRSRTQYVMQRCGKCRNQVKLTPVTAADEYERSGIPKR